jgi:hypothetical protein
MAELPREDVESLRLAKRTLETPDLTMRIAEKIGVPIEALVKRLPDAAQRTIADGTRKALEAALAAALRTLGPGRRPPSDRLHRSLVLASGALGGAAGLPGLVLELPFSLTVMLRSIADHAAAQGEDLSEVASRLECLAVFAYGSAPAQRVGESAYFATRAALARAVSQAAELILERGLAGALGETGAPAMTGLVARIAQRLGVTVTDKAAAQLVPLLGAAGGAAVNALFIRHYQDTAWAHFTVRRLERAHGTDAVRLAYEAAAP